MTKVSTNAIAPRITGMLSGRYLLARLLKGSFCTTIAPPEVRTAVAMQSGERIITPSMTAWPPTWRRFLASVSDMDPLNERN